jgi:hypothetical protein
MMLTYCKLCHKDVILPKPIPEDNKDTNGYIVCKKCHWLNYSEEKKRQDKREETLNKLLKKKWYKLW